MSKKTLATYLVLAGAVTLAGCDLKLQDPITMGPHDGLELTPVDTGRVAVGDVAPDFTAVTYDGPLITLSDYQGEKNVVLVFYRGHW